MITRTRVVAPWLRMAPSGGNYPAPDSEAIYENNKQLIDIVFPSNGGKLQADGSWLQNPAETDAPFSQSLKGSSTQANQLYLPHVGCDRTGIFTILDDEGIQEIAANNLVNLAMTRFDAPWDGVCLDLEGITPDYKDKLSAFLHLLSFKLRKANLLVMVAFGSCNDQIDEGDYWYDFGVISQVADFAGMYASGPYWAVEHCIQYALNQGIPPSRLIPVVGTYCQYYPISSSPQSIDCTYAQAIQIAHDNNAQLDWVESNENGLVRLIRADTGGGHIWIRDGDTLRHRLNLIDKYNLAGVAPFILGTESPNVWSVINDWKSGL